MHVVERWMERAKRLKTHTPQCGPRTLPNEWLWSMHARGVSSDVLLVPTPSLATTGFRVVAAWGAQCQPAPHLTTIGTSSTEWTLLLAFTLVTRSIARSHGCGARANFFVAARAARAAHSFR